MAYQALENGIFKFELEAAGRTDTALGRKGAAEHDAAVRQSLFSKSPLNKFFDGQHAIERAFLVQHARAVDPSKRPEDHLIPVPLYVLDFPQHWRHNFVAHLLGYRDAVGL